MLLSLFGAKKYTFLVFDLHFEVPPGVLCPRSPLPVPEASSLLTASKMFAVARKGVERTANKVRFNMEHIATQDT